MTITALLPRRGRLIDVRLSDGTYIRLDRRLCEEKGLAVGQTLTDADTFALEDESDARRCKERALACLAAGDLSEKKLTEKLAAAGFRDAVVKQTVDRLVQVGLLNDGAYLHRYVERAEQAHWSRREMVEKAPVKGLRPADVRQALTDLPDTDTDNAVWLLRHRYADRLTDEDSVKKTVAALARKGYAFDVIRDALKIYATETEGNE